MTRTVRLLGLFAACALPLVACNSGIKPGDVNVEDGAIKKAEAPTAQGTPNGDSLTAGLLRDTTNRPTGKQVYKATDHAQDRNHDGIAD